MSNNSDRKYEKIRFDTTLNDCRVVIRERKLTLRHHSWPGMYMMRVYDTLESVDVSFDELLIRYPYLVLMNLIVFRINEYYVLRARKFENVGSDRVRKAREEKLLCDLTRDSHQEARQTGKQALGPDYIYSRVLN